MKFFLFALFVLVLSNSVFAVSEEVFSDYVLANEKVVLSNGLTFSVTPNGDDSKVAFESNFGSTIVDLSDCKSASNLRVCYDNFDFSHYNYSLPSRIANKYFISIEAEIAKANLTRSFSTLNPFVGEQVDVSAKFTNTGNVVSFFNFTDTYPSWFDVILASPDCDLFNNTVFWSGSLDTSQSASCTYIIKPKNHSSFISVASVKHFSNGYKTESNSQSLTVKDYPIFSKIFIPDNLSLGDRIPFSIVLNSSDNLSLRYSLTLPQGFEIVSYNDSDFWVIEASTFSFNRRLSLGAGPYVVGVLDVKRVGVGSIKESFYFDTSSFSKSFSKESEVDVMFDEPFLRVVSESNNAVNFLVVNPYGLDIKSVSVYFDDKLVYTADVVNSLGHSSFSVAKGDLASSFSSKIEFRTFYDQKLSNTQMNSLNFSNLGVGITNSSFNMSNVVLPSLPSIQVPKNGSVPEPVRDNSSNLVESIKVDTSPPLLLIVAPIAIVFVLVAIAVFILKKKNSPPSSP